jgi:hypothetical protein
MHLLRLKAIIQAKDYNNNHQSKMITCSLEVHDDVDDLHKIFLSERFESERAQCIIKKGESLKFSLSAKDPVAMKSLLNSILKVIETYQKTARIVK